MDRSKVLKKIVGLLNLGDRTANVNEAEVEAAVSKAKQLMVEHAISPDEINAFKEPLSRRAQERMRANVIYTRKGALAHYDYRAAHATASVTGTRWFRKLTDSLTTSAHWTSIVFVGTEHDVAVATELFFILLETVRRRSRQQYGSKWGKRHTDYAMGFSWRLEDRAAQDVPVTQSTALVLADKSTAVTHYYQQFIDPDKPSFDVRTGDITSKEFARGWQDGAHESLDPKGIGEGRSIRTRNRG